ncbi:ankyrin repeat-containing domain protein [Mycena alexandri]|uniref:protein S-acyltransferase n=1 Tax=Mycena alexandri TaxID=1745969 RepID=A0AAD6RZN0_9AGAR|nr:ankyrin repeat-containing domain protein [Mycena alexandri]
MAEVVGLVASVLQLVSTFASAVTLIKDLHNAPREHLQLFSEIQSLQLLIAALQSRVNATTFTAGMKKLQDPLLQLEETLNHCNKKLQAGGPLTRAISWTVWNKKEANEDLDKIERFKTLLNSWLTLDIWDISQQQNKNYNDQRQDHYSILTSVSAVAQQQKQNHNEERQDHYRILTSVQGFVNQQEEKQAAAEHNKITEWLSPLNSFQRQLDIFSTLQPGTGRWLLAHTLFKTWEDDCGQTLWGRGIRGAGKTVLTSLVIHHLEARDDNIGIAWVYLNHKESDIQTPTQPTPKELLEAFPSIIAGYSQVYLIIDAFDEYPEDRRYVLLKFLGTISSTVNLMITSRPHLNLDDSFPNIQTVQILAADGDIHKFVDMQISNSPRLSKHVRAQSKLRDEILAQISQNAQGMFLLAKLHIDSLTAKLTIKAVREALQHLPQDLNHTYDEALGRIDSQNEDERKLARLVLMWVANAKRPLAVGELREALAIEPGSTFLDPDNLLDIDTILSVCAGLVIVDNLKSIVRLIHYTTQHYFDSIQADQFPHVHAEIALRCFTYLSATEFVSVVGDNKLNSLTAAGLLRKHPFIEYCHHFLGHAGAEELFLQDQIVQYLKQAVRWQHLWSVCVRELHGNNSPWTHSRGYFTWEKDTSPLWVSAAFNLQATVAHLLEEQTLACDQNTKDCSLMVAAYYDHSQVVQLLIEKGANANSQGAMYDAANRGNHSTVQALIRGGADLNFSPSRICGTPLWAAATRGHHSIVQIMVENGVDVNVNEHGEFHSSALQAAAYYGYYNTVQLLLEMGAHVNARGGECGTALQAATYRGQDSVVELLMQNGADVNAPPGKHGTALQAAMKGGHTLLAQWLIQKGADVNAQGRAYTAEELDRQFETPLQAAIAKGQDSVVKALIECASVDIRARLCTRALRDAAHYGNYSVVQLLIGKGTDVNAEGRLHYTALQAAAKEGHDSVVRLLIEKGADINASGEGGTALQAAARHGRYAIVQLLVSKGADLNVQGGMALQTAALARHSSIIKWLLEQGVNINACGGEYGTALQAAVCGGSDSLVRILLARGANVNVVGGKYGTALQAAASCGTLEMVELLLDKGADVNLPSGASPTTVQAATRRGLKYKSMVELLIAHGVYITNS